MNIYNQKFLFNYLVMSLYCFPFVSLIWYVIDIYPTSHEKPVLAFLTLVRARAQSISQRSGSSAGELQSVTCAHYCSAQRAARRSAAAAAVSQVRR